MAAQRKPTNGWGPIGPIGFGEGLARVKVSNEAYYDIRFWKTIGTSGPMLSFVANNLEKLFTFRV